MASIGKTAVSVTTRLDLKRLMANEFHPDGSGTFDRAPVERYIARLHDRQLELLEKVTRKDRLTAFITLGDGQFDRLMAASFDDKDRGRKTKKLPGTETELSVMDDFVRPNASFAFFNRDSQGAITLLFYTRYFVVSYRPSFEARKLCRKFDDEPSADKRVKLKRQIFNAMCQMTSVHGVAGFPGFFPVDSTDSRNRFRLATYSVKVYENSDNSDDLSAGISSYVPYIVLEWRNASGKWVVPQWMRQPNSTTISTIHGTISTLGCWMILRNHIWNWPSENAGDKFGYLASLLSAKEAGDYRYRNYVEDYLTGVPGLEIQRAFYPGSGNSAYYDFLKTFSGMHCNCEKQLPSPRPPRPAKVEGTGNTASRFRTSLIDEAKDYWKGEQIWFGDQHRKVTGYDPATKTITVAPAFETVPAAGAAFVLDNRYTPRPAPVWGANAVGTKRAQPNFGPWADAYLFKLRFGPTDEAFADH